MYIHQVSVCDQLVSLIHAYSHLPLDSLSTYPDMTLEEAFTSRFFPDIKNISSSFSDDFLFCSYN